MSDETVSLGEGAPAPAPAVLPVILPDVWHPPGTRAMLAAALPALGFGDRLLYRTFGALAALQITAVHGLANVARARDPFILVANHTIMREAVLMPTLLMVLRGGRPIHFVADWNFQIIPGVGLLLRRGRVITVTRKAGWGLFDFFRRFYENPVPAFERCRAALLAGGSIGIFPEGNLNRDPRHLLPGWSGAARLSLETGVPVVPLGIRFPNAAADRPIDERQKMHLHIGAPLMPVKDAAPSPANVQAWHATVMTEVARLSGKRWVTADEAEELKARRGREKKLAA